jgi:hypothetical protein
MQSWINESLSNRPYRQINRFVLPSLKTAMDAIEQRKAL